MEGKLSVRIRFLFICTFFYFAQILSDVEENVNLVKLLKKKIFHIFALNESFGTFFFFLLMLDLVYLVYLDKVKIHAAQQWTDFYSLSETKNN